jgi:Fe-S cluster assembly protein SufD
MSVGAIEGVTAGFNREALDARSERDPAWLREWRRDGWSAYEAAPLPTTRLEEWRYTDPGMLKWDRVGLAGLAGAGPGEQEEGERLAGRKASVRVLQVDTRFVQFEQNAALRAKGVVVADMTEAADKFGGLLREHLGRAVPADTGKFAALNAAFWDTGVVIHVPRGVRIEEPIRILRHFTEGGVGYFPRTLIIAEEGSHVGVVEEFASPDFEAATFSCGVVEIIAGNAANVQYVAVQRFGHNVHHISTQRTIAGRDADLDTLIVNLGGSVARVDLAAALEGPGSRSDMLGLYFARGDQHFDHNTRQDHAVPHATSDLLYKGALTGHARVVFRGLIRVYPNAQRTDAYQTNRNLILSRQAEAVSLPNLEIEADDVRCSHAATVGQLDEEEMFYIMTRGISREDAERLVVFGFFGEVLDRLPLPGVVEELRQAIAERISG